MKTETQRSYEERILRVLVHIQGRLDHALDLDELARVAHFSPYHFHRIFRGMVGESVAGHVRRLRLERAAWRLKSTATPVTQLAFEAGYETHEAFTRVFRAMFDQPPSRFREVHRRIPAPQAACGVHYAPDGKLAAFKPLQTEDAAMEARIENRDATRVAFMRHVGPYDQVGQTWQTFMGWAGQRGLLNAGTAAIGLCHDDPDVTPPEKIRYDTCVPVSAEFEPEGDVGVQVIGGGEYAVATHRGPYERLNETYAALLGRWLPEHNREPKTGPCFEVYRNNPMTTAPENLLTDVHVPLEARRSPTEVT